MPDPALSAQVPTVLKAPDCTHQEHWRYPGHGSDLVCDKCAAARTERAGYPEHAKLSLAKAATRTIGTFIEGLRAKSAYDLVLTTGAYARDLLGDEYPTHMHRPPRIEKVLGEYFGIDERKLEAEKDAMLDAQRRLNEERAP